MSRRTARRHVFSMIFQFGFHNENDINEAMKIYTEEMEEAEKVENKDRIFIKEEVKGIIENLASIDETINKYAEWSVDRIAKVDIAILRVAVYEILFDASIPNNVSANEAVELAKEFGADNASSFVNGVLGKVIENI